MQRTIPELLEALSSSDLQTAGLAGRELIARPDECNPFIDRIIDCLELPNYAIAEFARITIDRMGEKCMPKMVARFKQTAGEIRNNYLGLIAMNVDLPTFMAILPGELRNGDLASRFWAARCITYRLFSKSEMDEMQRELFQESINFLRSAQTDPTLHEYWPHARIALRSCGLLP